MAPSDHGQYSGVVDIARNGIDEVIRLKAQAKQDTELIAGLKEMLEQMIACHDEPECPAIAASQEFLVAARARLKSKP